MWPAGTISHPGACVFVALFGFGALAITLWLGKVNPRLCGARKPPGSTTHDNQQLGASAFRQLISSTTRRSGRC
jgi:hypothetical protein